MIATKRQGAGPPPCSYCPLTRAAPSAKTMFVCSTAGHRPRLSCPSPSKRNQATRELVTAACAVSAVSPAASQNTPTALKSAIRMATRPDGLKQSLIRLPDGAEVLHHADGILAGRN